MSASNYLELEILDHVLSGATYTAPATVYVALYTAAPSDSGGGTEVAGNGYARLAVTNNATNFPAAAAGAKSNGTDFTFGTSSGSWGTITHVGIFDAVSGGNLLFWGALTTPVAVGTSTAPNFPAGSLAFTCD